MVVLLTVRRYSAATGRSGRNHLHNRQDPGWLALNLIWLDKLNPGIESVRTSVQSFASICNLFLICSSHGSRSLSLKKGSCHMSMLSTTILHILHIISNNNNISMQTLRLKSRVTHSSSSNTWCHFLAIGRSTFPAINNKPLITYSPPLACPDIRQHRQQILSYILLFLHAISFSIIVFIVIYVIEAVGAESGHWKDRSDSVAPGCSHF